MILTDLRSDLYRRLGYKASPASEVTTRLDAFINEVHRKILATPGMEFLRDDTISVTSVASQEYLALPQSVGRIKAIVDRSHGHRLLSMDMRHIREINPRQTEGIPERYGIIGWRGVAKQPSDASQLFVDSTSASDTNTAEIHGQRSGGYPADQAVTMTGTTAVEFDDFSDWLLVDTFRLSVAAVGTVTLHEDSEGGTELARIPVGKLSSRYLHVLLDPVPSAARTYHVDFTRRIQDLTETYDELLIPEDFDYVLLAGVRELEYERREDHRRQKEAAEDFRQGMADLMFYLHTTATETPSFKRGRGDEFSWDSGVIA